jgi:N-acetylglucosamine kinase-like BadF-type ATPase
MSQYFLGVDGGGTKTAFLILDGEGRVCGRHAEAGSYHIQIGLEGLRALLERGVSTVIKNAGLQRDALTHTFFGLPAYGEDSRITSAIDRLPEAILGHMRYTCGNDMVCGWAGSLACADGINIVAGTGSICYGERGGQSARAGGWGELFGDEGSAYWIAVQGLNAFSRMSDGRMARGPLHAIIREEYGVVDDLDVSGLFTGGTRDAIAAVSRLVSLAAAAGDEAAQQTLNSAARELAKLVAATSRALGQHSTQSILVSYSGGVFAAGDQILMPFARELSAADSAGAFNLIKPILDAATGAALYAAKLSDQSVVQRIRDGLRNSVTRLAPSAATDS